MLRADGGIKMRKVTTQLAALALLLVSGSAFAWKCDFLTGGGFIFFNGNKANLVGNVNFVVRARDAGEPGVNDQFDIRLRQPGTNMILYDTTTQCGGGFHFLGSTAPCTPGTNGGGNIQLHKPNPSTSGSFGGSCPAL